jgi:hypothetical protein
MAENDDLSQENETMQIIDNVPPDPPGILNKPIVRSLRKLHGNESHKRVWPVLRSDGQMAMMKGIESMIDQSEASQVVHCSWRAPLPHFEQRHFSIEAVRSEPAIVGISGRTKLSHCILGRIRRGLKARPFRKQTILPAAIQRARKKAVVRPHTGPVNQMQTQPK